MDLDSDGHLDILSGSYSRMEQPMAGLFQVLYGKADGTFREAQVLNGTDGKPLVIPVTDSPGHGTQWTEAICTRPFAVDWDGDGKLDLVVGNFAGTFYWFKGEGKGKFRPKPEIVKSSGLPLKSQGYHSDPFVIDWDGDGALDLVSGSAEGGVQWAKNRAPKGKLPQLGQFQWLIKPGRTFGDGEIVREKDLTGPTSDTRIWVADVNGDGKLDLLVGDWTTLRCPAKGLSEAEYKKKFAAWQEELQSRMSENTSKSDDQSDEKSGDKKKPRKPVRSFSEIYRDRTKFMQEDRTGFVWLYLQK